MMTHKVKAYVSCLVLDAVLLAYFYIAVFPVHPEQLMPYGAFFLMANVVILGATFGFTPIRLVDPMKQQLGTQETPQVEHMAPPKYNPGLCDECGTPTGKARFCPNCGVPVKGIGPRQMPNNHQQQTGFGLTRRMVQVDIEGTALVPQEELQELKITKVKMGKQVIQNANSTEEVKPSRNKKVKPIPVAQPPILPVDDSPRERDIYEDSMPQTS